MRLLFKSIALLVILLSMSDLLAMPLSNSQCMIGSLPFNSEEQLVKVAECYYKGRVAKVTQVDGYYQLRVLISGGRIKTVIIDPKTGDVAGENY